MITYTPRFVIGMILLLTNQLFAWGGIILTAYWVRKTKKKLLLALGPVIYAFSWVMLFLGTVLAGPEGAALVKQLFIRYGLYGVLAVLIILPGIWLVKRRSRVVVLKAPVLPIKS
jgi:hypothetical protein